MRAYVLGVLALVGCARETVLTVDAPAGLASVLVLSTDGPTRALTARHAAVPLRIPIAESLSEGAIVRVLLYSRPLEELGLKEGDQALAGPDEPGRALPVADRGSFATTLNADWTTLVPAEAPLDVLLAYPPIDCDAVTVRSAAITDAETNLDLVVATGGERALLSGRGPAGTAMFEVQPDLTLVPRSVPASVGWLDALASDGANVWGVDGSSQLHRFSLRGEWEGSAPHPGIRKVLSTPSGRVFAHGSAGIYAVPPGTTELEPIFTTSFSGAFLEIDALDDATMIARSPELTYSLRQGGWMENSIDFGEFTPEGVTIDDRASYVVTQATLWERLHDAEDWTIATAPRFVQAVGAVAFGGGRVALHGGGGMLMVRVRPPPASEWCEVLTGTLRFMLELSVDPSGKTLFGLDTRDAGRPPLLIRVTLPD